MRALLLALLCAAPAWAEADFPPPSDLPSKVDLSAQFDPAPRTQGRLQTCHAFSAVALLEAAYYRATGERARLSEADVFLRAWTGRRVLTGNGLLREDLRGALDEGAAMGDFYPEFSARWKSGERRRDALLPEAGAASRLFLSNVSIEGPGFLHFAGSTVRTAVKNGPVRCHGRAKRRDLIMRTLADGLPVGAGFLLDGLSEEEAFEGDGGAWGAPHYMVLTGYERTEEGVVFTARNWWERLPVARIPERDLCALFALTWLR